MLKPFYINKISLQKTGTRKKNAKKIDRKYHFLENNMNQEVFTIRRAPNWTPLLTLQKVALPVRACACQRARCRRVRVVHLYKCECC